MKSQIEEWTPLIEIFLLKYFPFRDISNKLICSSTSVLINRSFNLVSYRLISTSNFINFEILNLPERNLNDEKIHTNDKNNLPVARGTLNNLSIKFRF